MQGSDVLALIGSFAVGYAAIDLAGRALNRLTARKLKMAKADLKAVTMKQPQRASVYRKGAAFVPLPFFLTERGKSLADLAYKLDLGIAFCQVDQREAVFFVEGAEPVLCGRLILRTRHDG